ncbi:retinoblastoma-binding protein 5-like [Hibiscus syriacus]|uniref:Retinoblastoma-binding protein 5-like n=1 Tax=Hibiscus syriacus TaxID=106335 RepID=A0A6A2WFX7_HIBSY|nr:retinoblastoma-binding protein 5-like [Hibiscus syriacus]
MEKHRCKLCLKSFVNGRTLGGHMSSHMLNIPIPSKVEEPSQESQAASASASYSLDEEQGKRKGQFYGLREYPKTSVLMVDPEFVDAGSVVLQDRESETGSSKKPTRRRSRKILDQEEEEEAEETEKLKVNINQPSPGKTESWAEPEPVSSISDTTTEEDVAFCLMMLSRDQWKNKVHQDDEEETDESDGYFKLSKVNNKRTARAKYRYETCNKISCNAQAVATTIKCCKKLEDGFIDLNLPAATDDDDASQIELSAVSDAEFLNHLK